MPTRTTRLITNAAVLTFITVTAATEAASEVDSCLLGMRRVRGSALDQSEYIGYLQDTTCTSWINTEFPARCAHFNRDAWLKITAKLNRKSMDFCMDVYEWPNRQGVDPLVYVDYYDAVNACTALGKRLCTEDEWTFACEGEEGRPYPYGYDRDAAACNIDRGWIQPDVTKLVGNGSSTKTQAELRRLWQGEPSGARATCVSPFGIQDMTGNVDEITENSRGTGYKSILKGGYWSVVRNRCRPSTRVHNEWFRYYQLGFRCCSAPLGHHST
ncbi:MAG: hypothetical protein EBR82_00315 [Caulobacteraceae bacterium]|nr:hypothetical protein [Caulobacteraceae bacterium]